MGEDEQYNHLVFQDDLFNILCNMDLSLNSLHFLFGYQTGDPFAQQCSPLLKGKMVVGETLSVELIEDKPMLLGKWPL